MFAPCVDKRIYRNWKRPCIRYKTGAVTRTKMYLRETLIKAFININFTSTFHTSLNCYYCISNSWLSSKGIVTQALHTLIEGAIFIISIEMVHNGV